MNAGEMKNSVIQEGVVSMRFPRPTPNQPSPRCLWCIMLLMFFTISLMGCNPEEAIQEYLAQKGLNPLAILRTDVEPGTLILVGKDGKARLAGLLTGYLPDQHRGSVPLPRESCESSGGCRGILGGYQETRSTTAEIGLSFFRGLFNLSPSVNFGVTGNLKVDQIDSSYEKISIPTLKRFLGNRKAKAVAQEILDNLNDGDRAFVAYEVHWAKQLRISSVDGKDIATGLEVNVAATPLGGKAGLRVKKSSNSQLVVSSDIAYAFAVKTGELVKGTVPGTVKFKATHVHEGDVKGGLIGSANAPAVPIIGNYQAVRFVDSASM